jgi:hypothetical protein
MTDAAKKAMLGANGSTGRLPQGTRPEVIAELKLLGFVSKVGLTFKGRSVREGLVMDSLAAFDA